MKPQEEKGRCCWMIVGQTLMRSVSQAVRPAAAASRQKHTLPDLPYDYDALEPHISADIMWRHHGKHHAEYVKNLNMIQEQYLEALQMGDKTAQQVLKPARLLNYGGHINHSMFWNNLSPNGGGEPKGVLMNAIKRDFGSFETMKQEMSAASMSVQGSGWGWLGFNKVTGKLKITTCANEALLHNVTGLKPLLGFDVWEHAYHRQYDNSRSDYIKSIWNVINWDEVSKRFNKV
uniref:Superoxide dismutase n=1 Tax=Salarias fasciatus TaxID=181472 RepID=A0A672G6G2_SALFA